MPPSFASHRVLLDQAPFLSLDSTRGWLEQGIWPAAWITHPCKSVAPCWLEFRLKWTVAGSPQSLRLHVAGDERYELYLDDELVGWGSERGTVDHWFFDSYDLSLEPGEYCLTARVWAAGPHALRSQMSVSPAFLLASETSGFSTGEAPWEIRLLDGLSYEKPFAHDFFSVGWNSVQDGSRMKLSEDSADWLPALRLHPGSTAGRRNRYAPIHLLAPAVLPVTRREIFSGGRVRHLSHRLDGPIAHLDCLAGELETWQSWWDGNRPLTLPPLQERRVLIDLEDYVCAWTQLDLSGGRGTRIQVLWAESLFEDGGAGRKGDRSALEGKTLEGVGDTFLPAGDTRLFRSPFIRAGRYLQLTVEVGSEPVELKRLTLVRAEYPLEITSSFSTGLASLQPLIDRCVRTVRASCHDSIIDGPYYEQMGWIGDTSQVALALYSMSPDDRLVRKALEVFDRSRSPDGLIRARWPARDSLFIPPYALAWINVLSDFSWWRHDPAFVRARLPALRAILDGFLPWIGEDDNLLRIPVGWNFVDWVPGWDAGIPPHDADGSGAVFQWQLAWSFRQAADLEESFGEPELAARCRRRAARLAQAAEVFWNEPRGLYANDRAHTTFSEHAQAYAALSGLVPPAHLAGFKTSLVHDQHLARATDPFTHYLFEAYGVLDLRDYLWPRLQRWFSYDTLHLLTTPEGPEPTRSDCHAWGAHAHFHLFASLLGLRPALPGFREVRIDPLWDLLKNVRGQMPHPDGEIVFRLSLADGRPQGEVVLPAGLTGRLIYPGGEIVLHEGRNILGQKE